MVRAVDRLKFALTSDQLELLLTFEIAEGLGHLAELMARDPSVVSRNLQRIAEDYPVLEKVKGRWELTPLGIQINRQTKTFLESHTSLLSNLPDPIKPAGVSLSADCCLLIINAQKGLLDATYEGRSNSQAEINIGKLLHHWRSKKRPIFHVQHVSENPQSAFYRNTDGVEFLDFVQPKDDEFIIEKSKASAFSNSKLDSQLAHAEGADLVLVGFTANECIDATARDASARGFSTYVVDDAVATFDLREPSGKLIRADRVHRLTMANIHAFYAQVVQSKQILL